MLIGYLRVSTIEQVAGLEAQERDLSATGCTKLFTERVSSVAQREQLAAALDFAREGDTLVVTKLDRLCRSVADFVAITERLRAKGVALHVLSMNLDTTTPTGKLMLNLLGSIAEFERELMLERQREGIARARAAGCYKGRAPTARRLAPQVRELRSTGRHRRQVGGEPQFSIPHPVRGSDCMTDDTPLLFADITAKLEDMHAIAAEGQRRDNTRDIQRVLASQLRMGLVSLDAGLAKIKRRLGDGHD